MTAQSPPRPLPPRERFVSSYSALLREIQEAGLLTRRRGHYLRRIGLLAGVLAAAVVAFFVLGDSWWQLAVAAVVAVVMSQIGFVAHDAAHQQVFAAKSANEWAARILAGAVAGLSYSWWNTKHNRHHGAPNQIGKDPDIAPGVVSFTKQAAAAKRGLARRWVVRQGWYFLPLLLLEGLSLHVSSLTALIRDKAAKHRWTELSLIACRLGGYVVVLLLVLPLGKAAAFAGLQLGLFGLLLGGSFAPNHIGMPVVEQGMKVDFLRRQVLMSRNIAGGWFMDVAMGGLNRQIEHHLFPSMPRPNLRRAAPIVRRHCVENAVVYTETSLPRAYRSIIGYLNRVGLSARRETSCPLAASLR
jgi:fatty acid desaturase